MKKKIILGLIFLLTKVYAEALPRGCEVSGFLYNGIDLVVNDHGGQAYYLIQNLSPRTIELQRLADPEAFMTPPLIAKLSPGKWAAFASDIQNMHFKCIIRNDAQREAINCSEVLDICQYPRVKFALSNMGNYWVSVNKTQKEIINDSTKTGIYLRW